MPKPSPTQPDRRPLRVVFALNSFEVGGTELNAVRVASRLKRAGVDLSFLSMRPDGPLAQRVHQEGIAVRELRITRLYNIGAVREGLSLFRWLRQHRPDVVHCHDVYTNAFVVPWARLAGVPLVLASRRWWNHAPRPELLAANRVAFRLAHRVVANSPAVRELLVRQDGLSESDLLQVPNFVDESAFERAAPDVIIARRRALGIPDSAVLAVAVARLAPVKNHALLLEALHRARDSAPSLHLLIVGDGPLRGELEALAATLGIQERVCFAGFLPQVPNPYLMGAVAVLSSESEGFPNTLLEAMAAGLPVVATRVGGVSDAVQDGVTGLLVSAGDVEGLASALASLAADRSRREQLGRLGLERARRHYTAAQALEPLLAAYAGAQQARA